MNFDKDKIKMHMIRFAIGFVATAFTLGVVFGLFALVAYYSIYALWFGCGLILIWTIHRTGKSIVETFYEDKEIWSTIVEDWNELKTKVKSFFKRG